MKLTSSLETGSAFKVISIQNIFIYMSQSQTVKQLKKKKKSKNIGRVISVFNRLATATVISRPKSLISRPSSGKTRIYIGLMLTSLI